MLIADVLNSEATLNDFDVVDTLEYVSGYGFKIVIRLKQPQHPDKLRYVADSGATLELYLPNKDGTSLTVTMTTMTDDRSIWSGTVTAEQTEDLASGNATFELTEGADVTAGWIQNALALVITGDC